MKRHVWLVIAGVAILLAVVLLFHALNYILNRIQDASKNVPHEERWGIYALDLATEKVSLIYSSSEELATLGLNAEGDKLVFSQKIGGVGAECTKEGTPINFCEEICAVGVDGSSFERLTNNKDWDLYPVWSPDGTRIAFLSWFEDGLDIYVMGADGGGRERLYDSGSHDADIHWVGDRIVFTSESRIWSINDSGADLIQITDPPNAGQWGTANLPFGDYDPRLSPDGTKIVFERMVDNSSPHGSYDFFVVGADGSGGARLTDTGYSQGLASWSRSGDRIAYLVGAINGEGKYDIYMMGFDGTDNRNVTPNYFPATFLCRSPIFSVDDSKLLFIGEWWE